MCPEIIIGKTSGFCFGSRNAVDGAEKELCENKSIYCLGEIIHNEEVVKSLEKKGLITIDNINDAKYKTLIRAHGTTKEVYEIAKEKNIELLDYTCPFVLNIHKQIEKYTNNGFFVFVLGIKNHPETIGNMSFCNKNSCLIENLDDVSDAIFTFNKSNLKDLLIISQTTFNKYLFDEIIDEIKNNISEDINLEIKNTICNATSLRQQETFEISKKVDFMIIIGGKKSSNTKKLYEISRNNCKNAIHIQTYKDLENMDLKSHSKIGIIAGASTPQNLIDEVKNFIVFSTNKNAIT